MNQQMEKRADTAAQVGVNNPHAAHAAMGSARCHPRSRALRMLLHEKGNSVLRSSQKSKITAKKLLGTKQKTGEKKLLPTSGGTAAVSTPTLREMHLRLEKTPSQLMPPSWRQDQTDLWSGPIWWLHMWLLRELLLGSYGEAMSPWGWVAGGMAMLSAAMTLGLSVPVSSTFQPRSGLKV